MVLGKEESLYRRIVNNGINGFRELLKNAKKLHCSRQSLLLASIDIETRARSMELKETLMKQKLIKSGSNQIISDEGTQGYIERISSLYEELLLESDLVGAY